MDVYSSKRDCPLLVRLSEYEMGQLKYFAKRANVSCAEMMRLGVRVILTDTQPSNVPTLRAIFEEGDELNGESG